MCSEWVRRRDVLALVGGAAAWPLSAWAQQAPAVFVGWLHGGAPQAPVSSRAAFYKSFNEQGYFEGRNVGIVFRGTEQFDKMPALAAELVSLPVAVLIATGTVNAALAAKTATDKIPVVFTTGGDPVSLGLVTSMNRPGGNVTGVSFLAGSLLPKRLELLRELIPAAATIAFLVRPANERSEVDTATILNAAQDLAMKIVVFHANTANEIDAALAAAAQSRVDALLVAPDAFFASRREQLASLLASYNIPASYAGAEYVRAGGLMSYGDNRDDSYRLLGMYVGRILKGEKPADLPVLQPTKFEFVINLKAAKALGIVFPPSFHLRADEVIE